jgi:hypothetical protein
MNSRLTKGTRKKGTGVALTLVEAAVTVVTLGVLVVWLLPAMAAVARNSKEGRCLSNLAQIGYANLLYAAEDPNDMAIPVHRAFPNQNAYNPTYIGAYEWGGKSGIGREGWVEAPGILSSKYGTAAGFGPGTRPLNKIIYGNLPDYTNDPGEDFENWTNDTMLDLHVHQCPADTGYTGAHCPDFRDSGLSAYDHFGTSYAANMFMTGGGEMQSNSPYLHRISDIFSPATTLAYQENNGQWAWAVAPENQDCSWIGPGVPGHVRGWHGKDWTFGATFVDGHADWIYMRGYRNPRVLQDPNLQDQYRCIIVRGDGWQKDTLPTPRVRTGLFHDGEGRPSYEDCVGGGL